MSMGESPWALALTVMAFFVTAVTAMLSGASGLVFTVAVVTLP